jgi:hypothetical protein
VSEPLSFKARLETLSTRITDLGLEMADCRRARNKLLVDARNFGVPYSNLSSWSGLTPARIVGILAEAEP